MATLFSYFYLFRNIARYFKQLIVPLTTKRPRSVFLEENRKNKINTFDTTLLQLLIRQSMIIYYYSNREVTLTTWIPSTIQIMVVFFTKKVEKKVFFKYYLQIHIGALGKNGIKK